MPIIFALIADTEREIGSAPSNQPLRDIIVNKVLPKLPADDHKRTLTMKDMELHYKFEGNYVYFCVASAGFTKRTCWAYIEDIQEKFTKMNNANGSAVKKLLKDRMAFFNDPKNDKIAAINQNLDNVKDVMIDNIDKILDRGENLGNLVQATDELAESGNDFKRGTAKVKRMMCTRWVILAIILVVVILLIILVLALALGLGIGLRIPPAPPAPAPTAAPATPAPTTA
jgi:vesicle-associated membrane protein 7